MGLFDRLKGLSTRVADNLLFRVSFENIGNGSVVWTDDDLEKMVTDLHNKNTDLFSVIDFVVNGLNKIDIVVKNAKGDQVETGDLYRLINSPNPSMGMDEFMAYAIKYKLVTGNTYVFAPRLTGGRFTEMWVMPAQYVKIVSGGWMNPVRGYIVENGSARKEFKSEEILHVKEVNLEAMNGEQLYGMSRLTPGRYTVDTNTMAQEASAHRFKNRGASALMTIKQAGQTGVSGPTPKAVNDLKRQIQAQMSGARKEGAIVATNMEAQIHKLDISAVDLGIFEGQRMTLHQICNLFHVPAILMDPTTGNTYNNIREAQKDFYRNAVLPELQLFLSAFNRFIGGAFKGEYLDYDTSNIEALQDDYGSMMTWLVNAPLTLNEKRKILGFEELPIPEANEIYIPSNWIPLELGGEMPKGVNNNTF